MLTQRQKRLFQYLRSYAQKHKTAPTYQEMARHLGLRSNASVHRLVVALEQRGVIRRVPARARAIEVLSDETMAAVLAERRRCARVAADVAEKFGDTISATTACRMIRTMILEGHETDRSAPHG